jgi:hypothetical protein
MMSPVQDKDQVPVHHAPSMRASKGTVSVKSLPGWGQARFGMYIGPSTISTWSSAQKQDRLPLIAFPHYIVILKHRTKACPVMIEHFGCRATGLAVTIKDRSLMVWQLPLARRCKTFLLHFKAVIIDNEVSRRYDRLLRIKDSTRFRGIVLDEKSVHCPRSPHSVLLTLGTRFYICQQSVGTLLFSFHAAGLVTVPNLFDVSYSVKHLIVAFRRFASISVSFNQTRPRPPARLWLQGFCCDACRPFCRLVQRLSFCLEVGERTHSRQQSSARVAAGRLRL